MGGGPPHNTMHQAMSRAEEDFLKHVQSFNKYVQSVPKFGLKTEINQLMIIIEYTVYDNINVF